MENILNGEKLSPQFYEECNHTLDNYLLDTVRSSRNQILMIDAVTEEKLLLSEFLENSLNLAAELQHLGCTKDTFVGIISENRIEFSVALFATILSGSAVTCFNPQYTFDELRHTFSISKPMVLFCSLQVYEKVKGASGYPYSKITKHIILLDTKKVQPESATFLYSNLISKSNKKLRKSNASVDDTVALLYSSGTTGLPKGVMLSHKNMVFMVHLLKKKNLLDFKGEYILGMLPMFHAFGFIITLHAITINHPLVIMTKFDEELFFSLIQKYKLESLCIVPPLAVILLKSPFAQHYNLSSLKNLLSGAAPLKVAIEKELTKKLNLRKFRQGYGMTEATFATMVKQSNNTKPGSVGCLVPGIQAKIVDIDTKKTLRAGEVGELCFKGPTIMKGYINNLRDTEYTIRDGWLHSGDIGYYDSDGDFFVVDRLKELIKYKAYQVAPAELEALLLSHEDIKDAAVIGVPDDEAGELPKAFIVKQPGSKVTEEELKKFVAEHVSSPKRLRGGVSFVDEIPKTASGKILRRVLRKKIPVQIPSKY